MINNHLDALSKYLQIYIPQNMKRVLILGDFYTDIEEKHIKRFCDNHNLKSLVKQRTCYKKPDNPTCIDLLSTNASRSFQSICVLETGLSGFSFNDFDCYEKKFQKVTT